MKALTKRRRSILGLLSLGLMLMLMLPRTHARAQETAREHGYLGVYLEALDNEEREELKFNESGGVLVEDVVANGPAEKAGIKDDDVILLLNGKGFKDESELRDLIAATKLGDKVAVVVFRAGEKKTLSVVMGKSSDFAREWETEKAMIKIGPHRMMTKGMGCCGEECKVWLGVEVQRLSDQLAEYFKVKEGEGMLIASVEESSPAQKAGLKAGDVIVKIGAAKVEKRADLMEAICGKKAGDEVSVAIVREGVSKTVKATLAEMPEDKRHERPMIGRAFGWCNPDDFNWEEIGPEIGEHLKGLRIELDQPMEDLQKQLDDLRREIDKLRLKLENK